MIRMVFNSFVNSVVFVSVAGGAWYYASNGFKPTPLEMKSQAKEYVIWSAKELIKYLEK